MYFKPASVLNDATEGTKLIRKQLSGDVSDDKKAVAPVIKRDVKAELESFRKYKKERHEEKRVLNKEQLRDKKKMIKSPILPSSLKSAKNRERSLQDKNGVSPLI